MRFSACGKIQGLDLNRDAVKLASVEANGLYRTLNEWDPLLFLDGHLMSRVNHGYANTSRHHHRARVAPGPRSAKMHATLFPPCASRPTRVRSQVFTHALFGGRNWPPTVWSHDTALWTVEAKFVVNDYGLRNRLAIITETRTTHLRTPVHAQSAYHRAARIRQRTREMQAASSGKPSRRNRRDHPDAG
jgi:hypothetical protein